MTKEMIRIHDVETGEIIDREMTIEEIAQLVKDREERETTIAKVQAAEAAKASAKAKLSALGLTEDEVQSITGGN